VDEKASRGVLGSELRAAIPALIADWRKAVAADPQLTASRALPRGQLEDHLPAWLDSLARVLGAPPGEPVAEAAEARDAEAHGVQRWQQGYDLHEVTREWACLQRCLVAWLERLVAARPELPPGVASDARLKLAEQVGEALCRSAEKYFRLERVTAAGNVRDLERALDDVRELERKRAELWQQAAHDLRGNLGVVSNVAQGLGFEGLAAERRRDFLALLRNNVTALSHLLDDVTGLARLQAGQEERRIATFDAAALLRTLADDVRETAEGRGLVLRTAGPDALGVEGDAIKVRRIAQNLVLNALKYTRSGGVTIAWEDHPAGDTRRWHFRVEDTGPGFHAGPGAPIADALNPTTPDPTGAAPAPTDDDDARPVRQARGEGIGLAIVKRLCDLLDASVEFESHADVGTIVRVQLPRRYDAERG
jgi:signal transduction histidine kinase